MNGLAILYLPDDEGIVLTDAGEEFVVWTELQFQNLILHSAKDSHRPASLHIPHNDGRIGNSLENCTLLPSGDDVT
jgi:hypothetical protein